MPLKRLLPALLLAPALLLTAQPALQERVTVSYVEVPVTVLSRDGEPLRGLTRDDFEILEDGKKRPIESFEAIDFAAERSPPAVSPLHPAARRNFLLLFDLTFSTPGTVERAQKAARDFVAKSLRDRDLVAVGTVDVDRGFRLLTAFTTDRNLLAAAVQSPTTFRTLDPLQIGSAALFGTTPGDRSAGSGEGRASGAYEETAADFARSNAKMDASWRRGRVMRQFDTLGRIAASMQGLAGRKHVVLLSEGFDPRLVRGRGVGESDEDADESVAIQFGEVWKVDNDNRFGNAEALTDLRKMSEIFQRSDVVLHAVDIQGVRVQNEVRGGAQVNSNDGLHLLTRSTGGSVFRNSNDISGEFDRLSRQHDVVYILGFQSPASEPGKFHPLQVRVRGEKGIQIQHRRGYVEAGSESGFERALTTAEVIVNDIAQDALRVDPLVAAFPMASGTALVPVILEIGGRGLMEQAKDGLTSAEVFVYAFDGEGVVRGSLHQQMRLEVAKVGERLARSGVRYYGSLRLPAGRYAIKTLVRSMESGAMGFRRIDLDVPAPGAVAMQRPLFFAEAGEWIMVKSATEDPAPYPFVLDGESFIPAALPALRRGEPRLFTVWLYNAGDEELTWEITPPATLVSKMAAGDVTKFVFAVEQVPAGARELAVVVRRAGSADSRSASVPIEVR